MPTNQCLGFRTKDPCKCREGRIKARLATGRRHKHLRAAAAEDEHEIGGNHDGAVTVALGRRLADAERPRPVARGQRQHVHIIEHRRGAQAAKYYQ